jgi:hypothetical protein
MGYDAVALPTTCFLAGLLLALFFDPEDGNRKRRLSINRLHGVISQETELSILSFSHQ